MNLSSLPISLNLHTREAEANVLAWGRNFGIVRNGSLIIQYKVLWFAGYTLPYLDKPSLERAMKLFLCLHHLDELLENCVFEEAQAFFHMWCEFSYVENYDSPFSPLSCALADILMDMEHSGNAEWSEFLWFNMDDYLGSKRWEFDYKNRGTLPDLDSSVKQAGFGSGVFPALHFLKMDWRAERYPIEWVEFELCRICCLSNDLVLFKKFKKSQLGANELVLRQIDLGLSDVEILRHGGNLLMELLKSFSEVVECVRMEGGSRADWADELRLFLGGCLYWSEENALRYGTKINGINKT